MKKDLIFKNYNWYSGWNRIGIHVLFWLFIFYIQAVQSSFSIKKYDVVFILYTARQLATVIVVHYLIAYYGIPNLLIKGKLLRLTILTLLVIAFMVFSMYYTFYVMRYFEITPPLLTTLCNYYLKDTFATSILDPLKIYNTILFHSTLFFTILIKTIKDFFASNIDRLHLENENIKLEKENINLELDFLKSQIHPHFFFNTLNNIYSLLTGKDDYAADIVLRLSDLMRYSLYESNSYMISLQRELDFISDYVELEKIRHKEHVTITLDIEGAAQDLSIPPLVLITFVENAFKHGVNNSVDASWVKISIKILNSELLFSIENTKPNKLLNESVDGGIGIMNVKRRLDLMYPNNYQLKIQNLPQKYSVNLKILMHGTAELRHSRRRTVGTGTY